MIGRSRQPGYTGTAPVAPSESRLKTDPLALVPEGRPTIAHDFNRGFPHSNPTSPVRDGRFGPRPTELHKSGAPKKSLLNRNTIPRSAFKRPFPIFCFLLSVFPYLFVILVSFCKYFPSVCSLITTYLVAASPRCALCVKLFCFLSQLKNCKKSSLEPNRSFCQYPARNE